MAVTQAAAERVSPERRRELYELMVLSRVFETEAERQYKAARIGGYCHLSSGQEATTVGTVQALEPDDLLVTGYRCHGFALARGVPPEAAMAELFGRSDGCAHGRGGSMHLLDVERGFYGGWGIVAGQLPVATGLALALVRQGRSQAVLCELGDGAVNMGAWHESLNLAALWHLPVVFLIVNNEYGMGTSVSRASAEPELWRRAAAHRMHGERVDGDDLDAVVEAADRLLRGAREERRPAVLEAMTYRYRGHSVADAGTGLSQQGGDRRPPGARPDRARSSAARRGRRPRRRAGGDRSPQPTSACSPPSSSRWPARSRPSAALPPASTPRAAPISSPACARAVPSARRGSPSTRGWAHERRSRARRHRGHDLPRGAATGAARGARP